MNMKMDASAAGFRSIVPQTPAAPWQCPVTPWQCGRGRDGAKMCPPAGQAGAGRRRLHPPPDSVFLSGVRPVQKTAKPTTFPAARHRADRSAHRHRRRRARRLHGTGSPARRRPGSGHRGPGLRGRGPRQSVWPGQSLAASRRRLPPSGGSGRLEPRGARRGACRIAPGKLPILLGGDHCLGIGSISAVARHCRDTGKKLRVLWLDAHADFNTHALTPTGNIHGMPVASPVRLRSGGDHRPVRPSSRHRGRLGAPDRHTQRGSWRKRLVHEAGLEVFDMRYLDEMGMRATMQAALAGWTRTRTCMSASM